jgi:HPt (histidine-containing phosphotransfer) domain-containing protein
VRQLEEQLGRTGLTELVQRFLDDAPARLAALRQAVTTHDTFALRAAAQDLKGTARGFGAAEMGEIAAQLERDAAAGSLEGGDARIAALAVSFERTRTEFAQQGAAGDAEAASEPAAARLALLERSVAGLLSRVER